MAYEDKWRRDSCNKSILTALSLDALGSSYADMPASRRTEWLNGGKVDLPRGARRAGTYNTDMTIMLLKVFYHVRPECDKDVPALTDYLRLVFRGYRDAVTGPRSTNPFALATLKNYNTMLGVPIGVAIGYYTAVNSYEDTWLADINRLIDAVKHSIDFSNGTRQEVFCLAVMIYRLLEDGYFGYDQIEALWRYNAVPPGAVSFFQLLTDNIHNAAWLSPHFTHVSLPYRMPYAQRVLAEALYYMARVSTVYDAKILESNPKEQLFDIFAHPYTVLSDVAYTYGAICTASEHNYSLVPKPLRIAIDSKHHITELLRS